MPLDFRELVQAALERRADHAAIARTDQIHFVPEFRKACEQDTCRRYGTNWMCPPGVGPFEEVKARALAFQHGLFFQTVHKITSSFDLKGMYGARKDHDPIFRDILAWLRGCSWLSRRSLRIDSNGSPSRSMTLSNMEWLTRIRETNGSGSASTSRSKVALFQVTNPSGGFLRWILRSFLGSSPALATALAFSTSWSGACTTTDPDVS